jgi:type II secretory pathway pseudopilin PulG
MKKILIVVGILAVAAGVVWASRAWSTWQSNVRTAKFNEDVENLFVALQKYKEVVGAYPVGGNTEVVKALKGNNPKNAIIIVGRRNELNEKGEYVDPWGTALRIYFSDNGVLIRSAGPNRRFDDSTVMEADDFIRSN